MQLRFTSLTVISSREDFHLQECAHAGRTSDTSLTVQANAAMAPARTVLEECDTSTRHPAARSVGQLPVIPPLRLVCP